MSHQFIVTKMWHVCLIIDAFNLQMERIFGPSWITCLDESMVPFTNEYCPSWVNIKRKPHPYGNEYHSIACAITHIIFAIELVETKKDRPIEGPHKEPEYEQEMGATPALCVRMTKSIWGSSRVVLLDSGFGYLNCIAQLYRKGLFSTCVIKKRKYWPAGTEAEEIIQHMQGKPVGYHTTREGKSNKFSDVPVWIGSMVDSNHTSIMANTWSTNLPTGKTRKRRVGQELQQIRYGEYQDWYYFGRHAVDDNNNNRQGNLSFEETYCPDRWDLRQFGFIIALCQTNSLLAYNYFNRKEKGDNSMSKAEFTRLLAHELVNNPDRGGSSLVEEYEMNASSGATECQLPKGGSHKSKSVKYDNGGHLLCRLDPYHGKWDGRQFPRITCKYSRCRCSYRCGMEVRTFCSCDYSLMLCSSCHGRHIADLNQNNS